MANTDADISSIFPYERSTLKIIFGIVFHRIPRGIDKMSIIYSSKAHNDKWYKFKYLQSVETLSLETK